MVGLVEVAGLVGEAGGGACGGSDSGDSAEAVVALLALGIGIMLWLALVVSGALDEFWDGMKSGALSIVSFVGRGTLAVFGWCRGKLKG